MNQFLSKGRKAANPVMGLSTIYILWRGRNPFLVQEQSFPVKWNVQALNQQIHSRLNKKKKKLSPQKEKQCYPLQGDIGTFELK